jgi:hypothetical protein
VSGLWRNCQEGDNSDNYVYCVDRPDGTASSHYIAFVLQWFGDFVNDEIKSFAVYILLFVGSR